VDFAHGLSALHLNLYARWGTRFEVDIAFVFFRLFPAQPRKVMAGMRAVLHRVIAGDLIFGTAAGQASQFHFDCTVRKAAAPQHGVALALG
jgi:hypothetical protein